MIGGAVYALSRVAIIKSWDQIISLELARFWDFFVQGHLAPGTNEYTVPGGRGFLDLVSRHKEPPHPPGLESRSKWQKVRMCQNGRFGTFGISDHPEGGALSLSERAHQNAIDFFTDQ